MRKLFCLLSFLIYTSIVTAQFGAAKVIRIGSDLTNFIENISPGTLVLDMLNDDLYVILVPVNGTGTALSDLIEGTDKVLIAKNSLIPTVSDLVYDATLWDANSDAATKNAIRDKIETLGGGSNTIYSADDVLTGTRSVGLGGFDLSFTGTGDIYVTPTVGDKLRFGNSIYSFYIRNAATTYTYFGFNATDAFYLNSSKFAGKGAYSGAIANNSNSLNTAVSLLTSTNDTDTGFGRDGFDGVSIITGGFQAASIIENSNIITTTWQDKFILADYGIGTYTGTAAKYLAVDASGNIIEEAVPHTQNTDVDLKPTNVLAANVTADGMISSFVSRAGNSFGDIVFIHSSGQVADADASTAGSYPAVAMAMETIAVSGTGEFLFHGFARNDTWNWTVGGTLYLDTTAGTITQTAPTLTGEIVQKLGVATHADRIYFNPDLYYITNK